MREELKALARMQRALREQMSSEPRWEQLQPCLQRLDDIDVEQAADDMIDDLIKSFGFWIDPAHNSRTELKPLAAVVFEWYDDDVDAGAYGFSGCIPEQGSVFIPREEYKLSGSTFDCCGGIAVGCVTSLPCDHKTTRYGDLEIFKVAEILHLALAELTDTEAFERLDKRDALYFLVNCHGRWPALAYLWKRPAPS